MKICDQSPCLFGKIKIWDEPLFDIDQIEMNLSQFRLDLMDILSIKLSKFYVKPPNPNTVLGKFVETIRFTAAYFVPMPEILEKFELGFGENGYYYDVKIKSIDLSVPEFCKHLKEISTIIEKLESDIESKLIPYYFNFPEGHKRLYFQSISNFDLSFESDEYVFGLISGPLYNYYQELSESSEEIIPSYPNFVQSVVRFNIISQLQFKNPSQYMRHNKYMERERFVEIHNTPPLFNQWRIFARGASIKDICLLFEPKAKKISKTKPIKE